MLGTKIIIYNDIYNSNSMTTKTYGRVKVKRVKSSLSEIPKDCGYDKQFKYDTSSQRVRLKKRRQRALKDYRSSVFASQ